STSVSGLMISYEDMDSDDNPLGLSTTLNTTSAGTGTLTIILRHLPNKNGDGVSDGEIANAGGDTDVEVTFNIDVE
ncbi:type 1 periplasmic binding fold superfamily protein, partial [Saprospiraceae bacterium]|nr:type 1 periplasmic binding fold superfamily protein [Saprospiraceae bacterium]